MQNLPNPDVNSVDIDIDSQKRTDIESVPSEDLGYDSDGKIPVSDDESVEKVPIEEPPAEDGDDVERIV